MSYTDSSQKRWVPGDWQGAIPTVAPQQVQVPKPIQVNGLGAMPSQADFAQGSLGTFPPQDSFAAGQPDQRTKNLLLQRGMQAASGDQEQNVDWSAINPALFPTSRIPYTATAPLAPPSEGTPRTLGGTALSTNPFIFNVMNLETGGKNIVSQTDKDDSGKTLAEGGDWRQISQGYLQIKPSTWQQYAEKAGVDPNLLPMNADYNTQLAVASQIPFNQWGARTKAGVKELLNQVGASPDMTFGEIASKFGQGAQNTQPQAYAPGPAQTQFQTSQDTLAAQKDQQQRLAKLMMLRIMFPSFSFTPIEYDPWAVQEMAHISRYQL